MLSKQFHSTIDINAKKLTKFKNKQGEQTRKNRTCCYRKFRIIKTQRKKIVTETAGFVDKVSPSTGFIASQYQF